MNDDADNLLSLVDAYVHGLLDDSRRAEVDRLIEGDPVWRAAYEQAQQRCETLRAQLGTEPSEQLIRQTLERVDQEASRWLSFVWGWRWTWSALAAAALIVAAFNIFAVTRSASPHDLRVYGQSSLLADADASIRVWLAHYETGSPYADVPVEIELHDPLQGRSVVLASFRTDDVGSGSPRFTTPDWPVGDYELHVTARIGRRATEAITRTVRLVRSWQVMLSSDKPVYQPGQTIQLRALVLRRPDRKPVAGHEATWSIADPKGNIIFKQSDVTSRFGIVSADCPLADEILHGPYTITCIVGDTESKLTVEVKPYVLPKFGVQVALDQPYYEPGQIITGEVRVAYFFGKAVRGAAVTVELIGHDVAAQRLDAIQVATDDAGKATFSLPLPEKLIGREQDGGDALVQLRVTVTDRAGQVQRRTISRRVTARPLRIEVIPESGELVAGFENTIYLFARYADGRPAQVRISVTGIDHELQTGQLGVASFAITPSSKSVRLTLRATDATGLVAYKTVTLTPGRPANDFLLRTDKAVYAGGETMRLIALGGGRQPVFVDLIKDGQTIVTTSIAMAAGRGEYALDLPPELSGTIEVVAYRFATSGLPVRKRRVVYVAQANELKLTATLDRAEYRPGQRARLQLRLTDAAGQPTVGAISLAAVDEAVFEVLSEAPGMETTFFALEQELLEPIYAIYNWSPFAEADTPTDQQRLFEQALFARTAHGADDGYTLLESMVDQRLIDRDYLRDAREVAQTDYGRAMIRQSVELGELPADVAEALLGGGGVHSLAAETYVSKASAATQAKRRSMDHVTVAWWVLAFVAFVALVVRLTDRWTELVVVLLLCILFLSLFLPALQKARDSGFYAKNASILRSMAVAGSALEEAIPRASPLRVRQWFPETLLWRPELITDEHGLASIDIDLADSITTWRLTGSAVSAQGALGGMQSAIRVFQPFFVDLNLPVALTRGDEVAVPVVVYNYLDRPQTVELKIEAGDWFELLGPDVQTITLDPNDVHATYCRIRVKRVGRFDLQVSARGSGVADAIRRSVVVEPDGRKIEQVYNGTLHDALDVTLSLPDDAIEGSARAILKLYPSTFSQVVEGLDGIFQRPYGCFEQTSSTTYPNVLALDYLRSAKLNSPQVEAKARQYIHLGYQRLLSFEVSGGGFDWFGNPPANVTLTAYGLMQFVDMARVHDVDPRLLERTRKWLLAQRNADGSWSPERHMLNDGLAGSMSRSTDLTLSTTAYVAWATFQHNRTEARLTRDYLLRSDPAQIDNAHTLALVANALLAFDANGELARPYLRRLVELKHTRDDGKLTWWQLDAGRSTFYGSGLSGHIETTALAAQALLKSGHDNASARAALAWLIEQKDAAGTWHTTQGTVLALKALIAASGRTLGGDQARRVKLSMADGEQRIIEIPADQGDVLRQVDLTDSLRPGANVMRITETTTTDMGYQLTFRYHVPGVAPPATSPLSIDVSYDRTKLKVGDVVTATATVINSDDAAIPMVIVDLPIPAGFAVERADLDALVADGTIAKVQFNPRSAVIYLRRLAPAATLQLRYRLRATMPVKVTAPAARVYEYYNPDRQDEATPTLIEVVDLL